jgi:hypothetical protein
VHQAFQPPSRPFTTSVRAAAACRCAAAKGPGEAYTRAAAVFVGTVGRTKQIDRKKYETTFAVGEVFAASSAKQRW